MEESIKYLKAMVFLQLQSVTGTNTFGKPELLLSQAGFSHKEIAEILGKNTAAVAKAVSRAKKSQGESNANDAE